MSELGIYQKLEYFEAKVAVRDDLIDILEEALSLIPVTQLQKGHQWMPSDEALKIIKRSKDRLREHRELHN